MGNHSRLGFIGLGKMGGALATRFADAGYQMCVFDLDPEAVASFTARGAGRGASAADVSARTDIVALCLPTPAVVESVCLGPQGLASGSARTVVDLGTTGPAMERSIAARLAEHGVTLVDSPVTGGISGARTGTLAVMVSCAPDVFADVRPLLETLGRVYFTGVAPGVAQTAKLANNLLSGAALAVASEAMAMGVKAGIDPEILLAIINAGSGRNSATEDKFPRAILPGTFDFGMSAGLFLKDVRLAVSEGESLGVPMIVGAAVQQMFGVTRSRFGDAADFTCIVKVIEEWAGIDIRRASNARD